METWHQAAPGYEVSDEGRVRSRKQGRWRVLRPTEGDKGYLSVEFWHHNERRRVPVHRVVALAFIPNPLGLPEVNHKDLNKQNNHVLNLEWSTGADNIAHYQSTIDSTPTIIRHGAWRQLRAVGFSLRQIAAMYGVSFQAVSKVVTQRPQ